MKSFGVYDDQGQFVSIVTALDLAQAEEACGSTQLIEGVKDLTACWVQDGQVVYYTPEQQIARMSQPSYPAQWSNVIMSWVDLRTLDQIKADQWTQVKQGRNTSEVSGFVWNGLPFQSSSGSQIRIMGAAQLAYNDPTITITWTLTDNTQRVFTAAEIVSVSQALGEHLNNVHAKSQLLREQIDAATTKEQVQAIVWVWP